MAFAFGLSEAYGAEHILEGVHIFGLHSLAEFLFADWAAALDAVNFNVVVNGFSGEICVAPVSGEFSGEGVFLADFRAGKRLNGSGDKFGFIKPEIVIITGDGSCEALGRIFRQNEVGGI